MRRSTQKVIMAMDGLALAHAAAGVLDDKKAEDMVLMDLRDQSPVMDYGLIVTGTSTPHLKALYDSVQRELKKQGEPCYRRAGVPDGGWMILDYVDLVIHILLPEAREYYALEEVWPEAPKEPLP